MRLNVTLHDRSRVRKNHQTEVDPQKHQRDDQHQAEDGFLHAQPGLGLFRLVGVELNIAVARRIVVVLGAGRALEVVEVCQVPSNGKDDGIRNVDEGIEDVEPCKDHVLEGALLANVRDSVAEHDERHEGEDIGANLKRRHRVSGEKGQDAVESSRLVENKRQRYQLGTRHEGHDAQEGLREAGAVSKWPENSKGQSVNGKKILFTFGRGSITRRPLEDEGILIMCAAGGFCDRVSLRLRIGFPRVARMVRVVCVDDVGS